jgi:hypothetical protein
MSTVTDKLQWNWTMAAMGFVGKNIECADQLLREGDRDHTERGQKMRQTGLAVIASMINALPTAPLQATGYDLATGKPWDHIWLAPWLRNATEDMRVLMRAYRRERALGREHPEWFNWVKSYLVWLVPQQREDGSFPRRWKPGSNEVAEPTGTTSYAPVPLLVMMSEETGEPKYQQSAIRAAEYIWSNWGNQRALCRRSQRQSQHYRQRSRHAQHGGLPESLRLDKRREVAGARQGGRRLRRKLDMDLEPAHAAGC